jgi:hypothetical protein
MLVGSNQGNYFEYATACSKRTLKTIVATQIQREVEKEKKGWERWNKREEMSE